MRLTLSDLAMIIPPVEKELDKLHETMNGADEIAADEAADMAVTLGNTSSALEDAYNEQRKEGSNFPKYEDLSRGD